MKIFYRFYFFYGYYFIRLVNSKIKFSNMTILNQVNDGNLGNPPQALGYLNAIEN